MSSEKWNGKERRMRSDDEVDRDRLLERIDATLTQFTQMINEKITLHVAQDLSSFKKQSEDIAWIQKCIYVGIGGLFILKIFFHV